MSCKSCNETEIHKAQRCIKCHRVYKRELQRIWRLKNPKKVKKYENSARESGYWTTEDRKKSKKILSYIGSAKEAACGARYSARKRQAVPNWLTPQNLMDIEIIYEACKRITKETGIKHHVDHIVPLAGDSVYGLHVP